jgi:spore coat polysaccharide biosynthesis predicted glycosyltransferase SpsG
MKAIFRAEFGTSFGMGHLTRCLKLANSFNLDKKPVLITRTSEGHQSALNMMPKDFWKIIILPQGVSIEDDAKITAEQYRNSKSDFVFTDLCHTENIKNKSNLLSYHNYLYDNDVSKIIAISDCRMPDLQVDLTVIPYECPKTYSLELNKISNVLCGLDYFISDPELTKIKVNNQVAKTARKIFVCIGGSDPVGITPILLQALANIKIPSLKIKAIQSNAMAKTTIKQISNICDKHKNCQSISFSGDFLKHAAWADVAITGEGLTKFETASIGTPTLMITQFDHDSDVIQRFIESGTTAYLGRADRLNQSDLTDSIHKVLIDQGLRAGLAKRGLGLIDGKGLSRIKQSIEEML